MTYLAINGARVFYHCFKSALWERQQLLPRQECLK
jgi:hypothetical protein